MTQPVNVNSNSAALLFLPIVFHRSWQLLIQALLEKWGYPDEAEPGTKERGTVVQNTIDTGKAWDTCCDTNKRTWSHTGEEPFLCLLLLSFRLKKLLC
jgi:hypothetical protein